MLTTAVSVAAYSTVVAETFAAVGLSTLIPAAIVTTARAVNSAGDAAADDAERATARSNAIKKLEALLPGGAGIADVLHAVAESNRSMDLLVPKSGKIHTEFAFEAREETGVQAGVSALIEVVTVKAGFAGIYEASTKNKITMDVEFALVEFPLVQKRAEWKRPVMP